MPARLIESLQTTEPLAEIFSDESLLQAMLDFEAALARAEAHAGIVPRSAAEAIGRAARADRFDVHAIARQALRAGTPGIPIAKALASRVGQAHAEAARFVHWGATSQDVADTALILLLKRAQPILAADWVRLKRALVRISDQHQKTVMVGRTLMQAALPITFGLKAAGWLGALRRSHVRMEAAFAEALVLQFGGASGTLAVLGNQGLRVGRAMAADLGLGYPDAPWHTFRDRLAALVTACGVLTVSLGKMARDISLLMQSEVGEVVEPGDEGRGGSSTMPQKQNPIASALTLAAASRLPGLVAAFLSGMVQEHERGVGGWQAEWPTVGSVVESTGLALRSMAEAAEGLRVNRRRMRQDIDATRGTIFAEKASMLLSAKLGREKAQRIVARAARKTESGPHRLAEVLAEMSEIKRVLDHRSLRDLETPEKYLGVAEQFRKRLLSAPKRKRE
ncbi:MAG TPA: 3-carboxy-cis,cis-muconate cycloisomerase [Candidatus Acidoferrales bacterium]|nr:3-carboxy-cis,cis-muconate cycloisomerase [Candidatus Acidoferrales bacterium]